MNELTINDVERLIKQLENPIRSAKTKAAQQLSSINIFPSIISNPDQLLHQIMAPILSHLSDNTESVRENCLKAIEKFTNDFYEQIIRETPSNFSDFFSMLFPSLFSRLENENVENSESIRLSLLKFILKLVKMITSTTIPDNFNSFVGGIIDPLSTSFNSKQPEMKKTGCDLLNEVILRCSQDILLVLSENIAPLIFSNCFHHHYEIRKKSLHSLALLYVSSGSFSIESTENLINSLQKLSEDRNSNVRKEVIFFCSTILTQHEKRNRFYYPLLIPLFYFSSPIVPMHQIEVYNIKNAVQIQSKNITEESKLSFKALNDIGLAYPNNIKEFATQRIFDKNNEYIANDGIVQIICDYSEKFINVLRSMIIDWTENRRKYGFLSLITFLKLCGSYVKRYSPHIMQSLQKSIRDNQCDVDNALQCQAILSSFLSGKDVVDFLCPQITNEGPREVIILLTVSIINNNDNFGDNQLEIILNQCLHVKIYESLNLIESLVQLVLAIIRKSSSFAEKKSFHLSIFILKLCEMSDALKYFDNAFDKSISDVFTENLPDLMKYEEKTPMFVKLLVETCPEEAVFKNKDLIITEISSFKRTNSSNKIIDDIMAQLKQKIIL